MEHCGVLSPAVVGMGADVVIYHDPGCGTSRDVLAMIHNAGIEPHVIEYLHSPPTPALLVQLIERAGLTPPGLLRRKTPGYAELGLDDPALSDQQVVDAMLAHPVLIERPLVVTGLGVRLCRPAEMVLDILPLPQLGAFTKENGARVVDGDGRRVREGRA